MKKIPVQDWTIIFWIAVWFVMLVPNYFLIVLSTHPKEWSEAVGVVGASIYFYDIVYGITGFATFMMGYQFWQYFHTDPKIQD